MLISGRLLLLFSLYGVIFNCINVIYHCCLVYMLLSLIVLMYFQKETATREVFTHDNFVDEVVSI